MAEAINAAVVDEARIARNRVQNAGVKAFADHVLKAHFEAGKAERDIAARLQIRREGSAALTKVDAEEKAELERLRAVKNADFDALYLLGQINAHQEALQVIDDELLPSAAAPQARASLLALRDMVAEHLKEAQDVGEKLGSFMKGRQSPTPERNRP